MLTAVEREIKASLEDSMKHCMKLRTAWALLLLGATVVPAWAQLEFAQQKNCLGCHAVDKRVLGPAYKDIAAKYAGQPDALDKLTQKVRKGGSGVWGILPMPANTQLSDAEARQLVRWILSLK